MRNLVKKALAVATLTAAVASVAHAGDSKWYDDVTFKGDFRYRYQLDTDESKTPAANEDRSRNRIRFRYGAYGKVNDSTKWGMRLATGTNEDSTVPDALSTNATLKGDYSNKNISLDLAYVDLSIANDTNLVLGKMKNPFWGPQKSQLVWDGDVTPEGMALSYEGKNLYANLGYTFLDSESRGDSATVTGLQVGYKAGGFNGAVAYYLGSSDIAGGTATGFNGGAEFINLGLEYTFKMGDLKTTVYGDYLINQDEPTGANVDESAFLVGANFSGGSWKFGLAYLDMGNSAGTMYQDSDFNGGKVDTAGYKVGAGYKFAKNSEAGLTYFAWEDNQDNVAVTSYKYTTLQADLKFKF